MTEEELIVAVWEQAQRLPGLSDEVPDAITGYDATEELRTRVTMALFELEATRRENAALRRMLEDAQDTGDSP